MRTLLLFFCIVLSAPLAYSQSVGISADGSIPNAEAQLHIKTNNLQYGLLNEFIATGSNLSYGTYNDLLGNSSGNYIGTYNNLTNSGSGFIYGTFNVLNGDFSKTKYGTYNLIAGAGLFSKYGSYNYMSATTGHQYATYNQLKTDASMYEQYGSYHLLEGDGSGLHYGTYNDLKGSGDGDHIGISNKINGSGSGLHYGNLTELSGSGDGLQIGNRNEISNTSNGDHWGTYSEINGNGSGAHKGSYNILLGSASGSQIGSDQQVTISGNGIHAGTTNSVNGSGSGIHYGSKNSLSGTGNGEQYGTHNEITNTGTGLHFAGWFDAPGSSNNYAAVFNRGDVVANEHGGNFDFRVESNNQNGMLMVDGTNDRVGIGTDAPVATFHMTDDDASGRIVLIENTNTGNNVDALAIKIGPTVNPTTNNAYIAFRDGGNTVIGSITGDGSGGTNFNTTSDRRLKTKIQDFKGALSLINNIQAREYERISNPGKKEVGFIAQELYKVYPQIVSGTPDQGIDDPMTVDYGKLTPVLLAAIQELSKQNEMLKAQLTEQSDILNEVVQNIEVVRKLKN